MIIYGKQLFLHLLKRHSGLFCEIYLSKEIEKQIFSLLVKTGVKIHKIDNKKAQALSKGGNHQGFLAKVKEYEFAKFSEIKKGDKVAVLYGLSDVGNIGSITRTAYAMGFSGIVVVGKNLAIEGLVRASSGAAYEIPVCLVDDGMSVLNELKQSGFVLYSTSKDGKDVNLANFAQKTALVMGSEGEGLSRKILEKCDENIGIKMRQDWDSLNVSVAFGIICNRIVNG